LADTLAKNIKIQYNTKVSNILKKDGKLFVNGILVVFLPTMKEAHLIILFSILYNYMVENKVHSI